MFSHGHTLLQLIYIQNEKKSLKTKAKNKNRSKKPCGVIVIIKTQRIVTDIPAKYIAKRFLISKAERKHISKKQEKPDKIIKEKEKDSGGVRVYKRKGYEWKVEDRY